MKSAIVIPARLKSTRLPRKLLLRETGKTLLEHTWQAASKSQKAQRVIIAADDQEIIDEVVSFGGEAVLTDANHACGTDRIAEVAHQLASFDVIVNVQGDEPELPGEAIDLAIELLEDRPEAMVATLATPIRDPAKLTDPNCVKVVFDGQGRALYFSRSQIPYPRNFDTQQLASEPTVFHQHVGIYAYRRNFLASISRLPPSNLETTESLEQLRFLDAGCQILVGIIEHSVIGIDTAEDYAAFVNRHSN